MTMEGLLPAQIIKLGENRGENKKMILPTLPPTSWLKYWVKDSITRKTAETLIMKARESWFTEEEQAVNG